MAKTFCNDIDMLHKAGFAISGGVNTADLIDQVAHINYHVCNKMGTSIPNMFARMFLFGSAYKDISSLEQKPAYLGKAHDYVIDPDTGLQYVNVYHHLISEHLDMLEFLFMYGAELEIRKWSYADFKDCWLANHPHPDYENDLALKGLKKLSDAIGAIYSDTPILKGNESMDILLFMYKNVIVGGTSPNLLVFTSPNWKREMSSKGFNFDKLFIDGVSHPLHQRNFPFRKLLTLMAMGGKFNSSSLADFKQYIIDNKDNGYDDQIKNWYNGLMAKYGIAPISTWVDNEIAKIAYPLSWDNDNEPKNAVSPIDSVQIYKQTVNQDFATEYRIAPTRPQNEWGQEDVYGALVPLKGAPMLIVPTGINGAMFFEEEKWNNATIIPAPSELCKQYLTQREVPGKKVSYPFVTADDFLESEIVELAYNIDRNNFFTACDENLNFMLPIKRMFFRFFTFEDLRNNLTITLQRDRDGVIEKVNVALTIPMETPRIGSYIIKRTYTYCENANYRIVSCRKSSDAFNLAFFPFFKSDIKPNLNSYHFMLGETTTKVRCWLGNFNKSGFVVSADGHEGEELKFTGRSSREALSTSFAEYNESFDYIELEATVGSNKVSGMFIPRMPLVGHGVNNKWHYSVDFGTSNTHIVMAETSATGGIVSLNSFGYAEETPQMVTLSADKSNKFGVFDDDTKREFVPKAFTEHVKFPIRSVVYEKNDAGINPNLFMERNVGFNYKREVSKSFLSNDYISDLKWNITEHAKFKCRVEAYCYQIMLMLRNHSLTHGGTEKIQVAVTFPLAMTPTQLRTIKDAWRKAWDDLIDQKTAFPDRNFMIESVAPYKYSVVTNPDLKRTDAYVNMDIGGGSTDILYYKEGAFGNRTKSRAYSVFFAANDLWGNGISPENKADKNNGFILNFEGGLDAAKMADISNYKGMASNSSDVVAYLFSKPQEYHFADSIRQSAIASIAVVHFASIIYYLANIIRTSGLEIPACINFSGMGSKYIDIIVGSNDELLNLVRIIFKHVGLEAGNIKVTRDKNPKEVTALGAAYMLDPLSTNVETPKSTTIYCVHGEEEMDDALTYADALTERVWKLTEKEMEKFLELLKSPNFTAAVKSVGIMYSYETLIQNGFNTNAFQASYITMAESFKGMSNEDRLTNLKDSPFFWALKDTLYNVALSIARRQNNQ